MKIPQEEQQRNFTRFRSENSLYICSGHSLPISMSKKFKMLFLKNKKAQFNSYYTAKEINNMLAKKQ